MILFFDTETTGLPKNWKAPITDFGNWPRLVQLAYQLFDDNGNKEIEGEYLVKPNGFTIPLAATKIHRTTHEKAFSQGINISNVLNDFKILMDEANTVVAHNLDFDEKIVGCEFLRLNLSNPFINKHKICTMKSSTNFCAINGPYGYKWPSLSELHYKLFNTYFEEAHNAMIDIQATSRCFWELVRLDVIRFEEDKNIEENASLIPCYITIGEDKKYGYMFADTKKVAIKCQFDNTYPFHGNIAKVVHNGMIRYVTSDGLFIQPYVGSGEPLKSLNPTFETGIVPAMISRNMHPISTEYLCGYIDTQSDEIIKIPFIYNDAKDFIGRYAVVKKRNKWGIIDEDGNEVVPLVYDYLKGFSDNIFIAKKNGKWGVIDKKNIEILPIIYDKYLYSHQEKHYHTLSKDGKFGFYDIGSNKLFDLKYDGATVFSEDCAAVKIDGKWGYIDLNWNIIIPFVFDGARAFNEGVASVKQDKKWGYISKSGELILPYKYNYAGSFFKGIAQVEYPLSFKQKIQIFFNGEYKRILHKINIKGESVSSWKAIVVKNWDDNWNN